MALNMRITLMGKPDENLSKTTQSTVRVARTVGGSADGQALGRIHAIVKHVGTSVGAAAS
jgi:hypothetical protein